MALHERLESRGDQNVPLFSPIDSLLSAGGEGGRDGAAGLQRQREVASCLIHQGDPVSGTVMVNRVCRLDWMRGYPDT